MSIAISGKNTTSGVTIEAPRGATQFPEYFIGLINSNELTETPGLISIGFPTEAPGFNLTSFGRTNSSDGFPGTVWRLRNGENAPISATLRDFSSGVSNTYNLAANSDTFIFSFGSNGAATHILSISGRNIPKAASTNLLSDKDEDRIDGDSYEIIGGSGDDSLLGAILNDTLRGLDGNDTLRGRNGEDELKGGDGSDRLFGNGGEDSLEGEAGNDRLFGGVGEDELKGGDGRDTLSGGSDDDTLTGGSGADRFRFTNQGEDEVSDFDPDDDIFQIRVDRYFGSTLPPNAPEPSTDPIVGAVIDPPPGVNIYVDTSVNIGSDSSGTVYFAYATDTSELLYDADGDWTGGDDSGTVLIADTNSFVDPTAANFDFV